ncbi:type I-E CRISPR-associated protein Cas7/Cse4/CasC [Spirillospora sp. NPDC052269]
MSTRIIVELHALQTVPPSNLNRDDTGTPKSALYGGVRRARVSSQAWKRATRKRFHDLLDPNELGVRTKRVAEELAKHIRRLDDSIPQQEAWDLAAETIQTATGSKIEPPKRAKKADDTAAVAPESKYLMFFSTRQLAGLAELAVKGRDDIKGFFKDKDNKAEAKQLANSRHSVDIALFGRMVADGADVNVDAAAQVAHALSVHRAEVESDYYTAVDDAKSRENQDDLGAGMIGTVEFNSATLYRFAAVDIDLLRRNLGAGLRDDEPGTVPVRRAVEAFVEGFITSLPTGKINTFGNHTLPDAVLVKLRSSRPISLVAAFEEPVRPAEGVGGHVRGAAERLTAYLPDIESAYGVNGTDDAWVMTVGPNTVPMQELGDKVSLPELVEQVGAAVAARLDDQQ